MVTTGDALQETAKQGMVFENLCRRWIILHWHFGIFGAVEGCEILHWSFGALAYPDHHRNGFNMFQPSKAKVVQDFFHHRILLHFLRLGLDHLLLQLLLLQLQLLLQLSQSSPHRKGKAHGTSSYSHSRTYIYIYVYIYIHIYIYIVCD